MGTATASSPILFFRLVHRERIKRICRGKQQVLPTIELITDGTGGYRTRKSRVPENPAVRRIQGDKVRSVAREQQLTGRGEHVRRSSTVRPVMFPGNVTGLHIEGNQRCTFRARRSIESAPALRM